MLQLIFVDPSTSVPVAGGGNVGNGTMSIPIVSSATLTETITVECTVPGGAGVGQFSVTGSVSGPLGAATSDIEFVDAKQKIRFSLTAGATPWAVGDEFTFSTVAGTALNESTFNALSNRAPFPSSSMIRKFHDMDGNMGVADVDAIGGYVAIGSIDAVQVDFTYGIQEFRCDTTSNVSTLQPGNVGAQPSALIPLNSQVRRLGAYVSTGFESIINKDLIIGIVANDISSLTLTNLTGKGIFFKIRSDATGTNIIAVTKDGANSLETSTDTGIPDSAAYHEFEIRATSTVVQFFIDGALVATHTTNIPSVGLLARISFRARENATKKIRIDWIAEEIPSRPV